MVYDPSKKELIVEPRISPVMSPSGDLAPDKDIQTRIHKSSDEVNQLLVNKSE